MEAFNNINTSVTNFGDCKGSGKIEDAGFDLYRNLENAQGICSDRRISTKE